MVSVFRHTLQKQVGGLAVSQNFIQIHFHNLRFQWKKKPSLTLLKSWRLGTDTRY